MTTHSEPDDIRRFIKAIEQLAPDNVVPKGTPGYNNYTTQRAHWLGWLGLDSEPGSFLRSTGPRRGARYVYNHINEPKMLLWLIEASGVRRELRESARRASDGADTPPGKAAAIRKAVPWSEVLPPLSRRSGVAV
jgi:hypothetical protein